MHEQYKELYEQQIQANKDVAAATQEAADAQEKYSEKKQARIDAEEKLQDLIKNGADYEGDLQKAEEEAMEAAEKARTEEEKYRGELEKVQENLLITTGKQEGLNVKMQEISGILDVVSGKYDVSKDSLDKLRDAYDEGFINADELKKQFNMTADELYEGSKSMAERTNEGYADGIVKGAQTLEKTGAKIGINVIKGAKNALGIHSPSAEAYDLASYTIEGFTNRIDKDKSAEYSVKRLMERVIKAMKDALSNIDFSAIFTQMWEPAKNVLNSILDGFENFFNSINYGLNSVINNLNTLSKSTGNITGSYTIYSDFSNIKIPRLATGAYVPANYGEFLAILGDNKREPEFVTPESKLDQAISRAMEKYGFNREIGDIHVTVTMPDGTLLNAVGMEDDQYKKRHGRSRFAY